MARERLNTTQRKHEAARRIAPVGADRHRARHVEGGRDFSGGSDPDTMPRIDPDQRIVDEIDALAHRHAHMIHEFQWRRPGAAFVAVDDDEIRIYSALNHRLADREEFPGMADAQFEPGRLAAGQPPHLGDEAHHLQRRRKCPVGRGRDAVLIHGDAPDLGYLFRYLGGRKHPAMSGLGALADLEFHHLDLIMARHSGELVWIERPIAIAATEIPGTDFPDQVAAVLTMIRTDAALAGVMGEAALFRACVQSPHRIRAERAEAHG